MDLIQRVSTSFLLCDQPKSWLYPEGHEIHLAGMQLSGVREYVRPLATKHAGRINWMHIGRKEGSLSAIRAPRLVPICMRTHNGDIFIFGEIYIYSDVRSHMSTFTYYSSYSAAPKIICGAVRSRVWGIRVESSRFRLCHSASSDRKRCGPHNPANANILYAFCLTQRIDICRVCVSRFYPVNILLHAICMRRGDEGAAAHWLKPFSGPHLCSIA